jgi:hypothetical protein
MANEYQTLLRKISVLEGKVGGMIRVGTCHQVKGDKLRMNYATDDGGKPVLSPWLHHTNHRGEHRERQAFSDQAGQGQQGQGGQQDGGGQGGGGAGGGGAQGKQNGGQQSVTAICPNGDWRQAIVMPYGPNNNHKAPDHANKSGKGEHVYQFGEYRKSYGKDGYDYWLEKEEQQQGGQGQGQGGQDDGKRKVGGDKADMKTRMNKETGITHRVGKDVMSMVHKDGAKMKADKEVFIVVSKKDKQVMVASKEPPITDKPWEVKKKKDPIEDDKA